MVKFKILGSATEKIGAKEMEIKSNSPTKIRDLLPTGHLDEDLYIILVNGKSSTLEAKVNDSDKVVILPRISGG